MQILLKGNLAVREMQDDAIDYLLMLDWLSTDVVAEHYGGKHLQWTAKKIHEKYKRKIQEEYMHPCIIELDGKPIGYIQFYETCKDGEPTGKEPELWMEPGNYGIDMFIGIPDLWGKGIGSRALHLTAQHLLSEKIASSVTIDPKISNERAIRAYEKAGFKKVQIMPSWEEENSKKYDSLLMQFKI